MRIGKVLLWLSVIIAGLVILVPSSRLAAQEDRVELVLQLLPGYYHREITSGEVTTLYLEIRNVGDQEITDVRLISDNPKGWVVGLKPDSIDYHSAGSAQTIDVSVTVPPAIERGEYTLTLIAEAAQTRTATSTVLRVEGAFSFWLWIGGGLAVLVIAIFVIIFIRFGRE